MNKVFLFALQLGVLAPFWRSMQALLWANSGRAPEGALWNIVYCGGPLLIACALARWRILKGKVFPDSGRLRRLAGVARLYVFRLGGGV